MTRRCSHCSSNGHNTRSCSARTAAAGGGGGGGGGGLRLFGVRLVDGSFIKKSASMGNLSHYSATADSPEGYHSDDPDRGFDGGRRSLRKKGIPWTEEEHRQFLLGLQKLGKGDWRGISKNYVPSRTPTQVASHAQKYFIRQTNATRKKKRTSLFDMVPNSEINPSTPEQSSIPSPTCGIENEKLMLSSSSQDADTISRHPSLDLSLKPAFTPLPFELWPSNAHSLTYDGAGAATQNHVLSKVPAVQEQPVKELLGLSQLNLGKVGTTQMESSPLSLRQPGMP